MERIYSSCLEKTCRHALSGEPAVDQMIFWPSLVQGHYHWRKAICRRSRFAKASGIDHSRISQHHTHESRRKYQIFISCPPLHPKILIQFRIRPNLALIVLRGKNADWSEQTRWK